MKVVNASARFGGLFVGVNVMSAMCSSSSPRQNPDEATGQRVMVSNVDDHTNLNGRKGFVSHWESRTGRWVMQLTPVYPEEKTQPFAWHPVSLVWQDEDFVKSMRTKFCRGLVDGNWDQLLCAGRVVSLSCDDTLYEQASQTFNSMIMNFFGTTGQSTFFEMTIAAQRNSNLLAEKAATLDGHMNDRDELTCIHASQFFAARTLNASEQVFCHGQGIAMFSKACRLVMSAHINSLAMSVIRDMALKSEHEFEQANLHQGELLVDRMSKLLDQFWNIHGVEADSHLLKEKATCEVLNWIQLSIDHERTFYKDLLSETRDVCDTEPCEFVHQVIKRKPALDSAIQRIFERVLRSLNRK